MIFFDCVVMDLFIRGLLDSLFTICGTFEGDVVGGGFLVEECGFIGVSYISSVLGCFGFGYIVCVIVGSGVFFSK